MDLPPDTPPELSTGFDAGLQNLIHETERKSARFLKEKVYWFDPISTAVSCNHHSLHRVVDRDLETNRHDGQQARSCCVCV